MLSQANKIMINKREGNVSIIDYYVKQFIT